MSSQAWIRRSLSAVAVLYALLLLAALLGRPWYMDREFVMWQQVRQSIHDSRQLAQADLIYLGDSRAKAGLLVNRFEQQSGHRVLNLTLGGATPIEGYYSLKAALKHSPARAVIISYAPYHLARIDTYWFRAVKFNYLRPGQYRKVQQHASRLQEPALLGDHYLNYWFKPGLYLTDAWHGLLERRWRINRTTRAELQASGGHYFFGRAHGFSGLNEENVFGPFRPSPVVGLYLQKIIRLAQDHGVTLYWYNMPFNRTSLDSLPADYVKEYEHYLSSLASEHFVVLNGLYAEDDALFGDWSHIYLGADKVTQDVFQAFQAAKLATRSLDGVASDS